MIRWLFALLPLLAASCRPAATSSSSESPIAFAVPAFSFTERGGRTVTNADLKGQVWVASFVFTRCNGSCPAVTATVAKLNADYKTTAGLKFVTFTVDPDRDTLGELKKYAERYQADADRWLFLTGPEAAMHKFSTEGFKLAAIKNKNGMPGDEFDHSSKLAVVDKQGTIRGYYEGMAPTRPEAKAEFEASQQSLKELIAKLLTE